MLAIFLLVLLLPFSSAQDSEKKVDKKEEKKECPPYVCVKNGNFADPCHCRRYITCTNGAATTRVCPSGLYWDDERLFCTYKSEAKCGPIKRKKKKDRAELPQCDKEECQLPFCFCSRNGMEGPIPAKSTGPKPQVIVMTFDGAVNLNNFQKYDQILKITKGNKTNECPIRGTFFITHNYNDYQMVEYFYSKGHEIAVSSVTGKTLQFANKTFWRDELMKTKEFLNKYGNIPKEDILGARAPQLNPGDEEQFDVMIEEGFVWDSSISTKDTDFPIWPYTLDYRIPHECKIKSCPKKAYPGFWEIPVNLHNVEDQSGGSCSYLDQCIFSFFDDNDVFKWLKEDFLRFYESNRAPYTLPFHTNWFTHAHQVSGLKKFIHWTLEQPQVYYLTATEVLIWMTEPTIDVLQQLTTECNELQRPVACKRANTCQMPHEVDGLSELRYMNTCNECIEDEEYPWVTKQYQSEATSAES